MPDLPSGGIYGRPRRVSCARTLDELSYEVAYAIDLQDANRLAGIYHWVGMDSRNAYRVFNQLESIVKRPLVDIAPVFPRDPELEPVDDTGEAAGNGPITSMVRHSMTPGMPIVGKTSARLNQSRSCSSSGVPRKNQM